MKRYLNCGFSGEWMVTDDWQGFQEKIQTRSGIVGINNQVSMQKAIEAELKHYPIRFFSCNKHNTAPTVSFNPSLPILLQIWLTLGYFFLVLTNLITQKP